MVESRCRGIGPPSGIPSPRLCFCWLPTTSSYCLIYTETDHYSIPFVTCARPCTVLESYSASATLSSYEYPKNSYVDTYIYTETDHYSIPFVTCARPCTVLGSYSASATFRVSELEWPAARHVTYSITYTGGGGARVKQYDTGGEARRAPRDVFHHL